MNLWYNTSVSADHLSLIEALDRVVLPVGKQLRKKPFRAIATVLDTSKMELEVQVLQGAMPIGSRVGIAMMRKASVSSASVGSSCRLYIGRVSRMFRDSATTTTTASTDRPSTIQIALPRDRGYRE